MRDLVDEVAREYLRDVRIKDEYVSAPCPFHKGGQERHPSFWISRSVGNWGCFTCHQGGKNLAEFLAAMGAGSRVVLQERVKQEQERARKEGKKHELVRKRRAEAWGFKGTHILPEALLGVFDFIPIELVDSGFLESTLEEHEVGYDRKRDRITFPIRDVYGNLVGISGRQPEGCVPKYKVYTGYQSIDGERHPNELGEDFPSYKADDVRNHLWGGHLVWEDLYNSRFDQLVLVEGYKAAMWMRQLGWKFTVAAMGSSLTRQQVRIIRATGASTIVLLDNNLAGREGSQKICSLLAEEMIKVYECTYFEEMPEWVQPDDLDEDEIEQILSSATRKGVRWLGGQRGKVERFQKSRSAEGSRK